MGKIFVSCCQFTDAEKIVGKEIVRIVKALTGIDAFFAEEVQDLNGLDSNIFGELRDCVGFIIVIHPRGKITRPDCSAHTRASVWIEHQIAIATYIQRVERRTLPVIAFIHKSVGREGLRDLLHLNPIFFNEESEIISALPERLAAWKSLTGASIRLQLQFPRARTELEHRIRYMIVSVVNGSNQRITSFNCEVRLPVASRSTGIRKAFPAEIKRDDPRFSCYRFDELYKSAIAPHATEELIVLPCCITCARADTGEDQLFCRNYPGVRDSSEAVDRWPRIRFTI